MSGVLAIVLVGGGNATYLYIAIALLTVAALAIWIFRVWYEKNSHEKYLRRNDYNGNRAINDKAQSEQSGGFSTAAIVVELSSTVLSVFLLLIFSVALLAWGVSIVGKDLACSYLDKIERDPWSHDSKYDVLLKLKNPEQTLTVYTADGSDRPTAHR